MMEIVRQYDESITTKANKTQIHELEIKMRPFLKIDDFEEFRDRTEI